MRVPSLEEQLDRFERVFPTFLAKLIRFLRAPHRKRLRLTLGALLILGGCFFWLPILCLEMIPIGLMLIALDIPFLRQPVARMIAWIERMVVRILALWESIRARVRMPRPHH